MSKTCYNCGTENADTEQFCHACGAALGARASLQDSGLQAGIADERVLWENGDIKVTSAAVLIGMESDAPDVVPLETIYEVVLEERCVVLKVKDGDDKHCMLDDPTEMAEMVRDQMMRSRLAHGRTDMGYIPPD